MAKQQKACDVTTIEQLKFILLPDMVYIIKVKVTKFHQSQLLSLAVKSPQQ